MNLVQKQSSHDHCRKFARFCHNRMRDWACIALSLWLIALTAWLALPAPVIAAAERASHAAIAESAQQAASYEQQSAQGNSGNTGGNNANGSGNSNGNSGGGNNGNNQQGGTVTHVVEGSVKNVLNVRVFLATRLFTGAVSATVDAIFSGVFTQLRAAIQHIVGRLVINSLPVSPNGMFQGIYRVFHDAAQSGMLGLWAIGLALFAMNLSVAHASGRLDILGQGMQEFILRWLFIALAASYGGTIVFRVNEAVNYLAGQVCRSSGVACASIASMANMVVPSTGDGALMYVIGFLSALGFLISAIVAYVVFQAVATFVAATAPIAISLSMLPMGLGATRAWLNLYIRLIIAYLLIHLVLAIVPSLSPAGAGAGSRMLGFAVGFVTVSLISAIVMSTITGIMGDFGGVVSATSAVFRETTHIFSTQAAAISQTFFNRSSQTLASLSQPAIDPAALFAPSAAAAPMLSPATSLSQSLLPSMSTGFSPALPALSGGAEALSAPATGSAVQAAMSATPTSAAPHYLGSMGSDESQAARTLGSGAHTQANDAQVEHSPAELSGGSRLPTGLSTGDVPAFGKPADTRYVSAPIAANAPLNPASPNLSDTSLESRRFGMPSMQRPAGAPVFASALSESGLGQSTDAAISQSQSAFAFSANPQEGGASGGTRNLPLSQLLGQLQQASAMLPHGNVLGIPAPSVSFPSSAEHAANPSPLSLSNIRSLQEQGKIVRG